MQTTMHRRLLRRLVLPAAPIALAGPSAVKGSIVYTDVSDLTTTTVTSAIFWDMGANGLTGSAQATSFAGSDLSLTFGLNEFYQNDINHPNVSMRVGYSYIATSGVPQFARKFTFGEVVNVGGSAGSSKMTSNGGGNGNWDPDGSQGYIGFRFEQDGNNSGTNFRNGWARISYNADKSLTLYDFAYESSGGSIPAGAGAVPEPSAAITSLLAGSAALYRRRRRPRAAFPAQG